MTGRQQRTIPRNQLIQISPWKRLASSGLYLVAMCLRLLNGWRKENPRRVLVLEPVGLGDMVGFTPLIRELLAREYEVVICSKPEWRALYPDQPRQTWIDVRLPWTSHNERVKYQLGLYFKDPTRGDLRRMRAAAPGAIGIDTRGDIRSVILLYWAGCRRVISLSNYLGSDLTMWPIAAEIIPFDNQVRRWELNVQFLRALDPYFNPIHVDPPRLHHLINKFPRPRVGLMPIAPWAGKLWPRDRWIAVAGHLQEKGWEVVGLCGPKQTESGRAQLGPNIPMIECGSVESWSREFNQCAFVITIDSGPMHLADAMDVPVIALFGQGKLPLWAPSGQDSIVLAHQDDPDFYVCHMLDEYIPLGQKFMNRITVEEVLAAANSIIEKLEIKNVVTFANPSESPRKVSKPGAQLGYQGNY
jgi:ADP-heptose:LPS heptosyltransferase